MDTSTVRVLRVEITREEIDLKHKTAGAEIAAALFELMPTATRLYQVFPLARERLLLQIEGVPTAVANALRRVLKDEMRGHCLTFDRGDLSHVASTDAFMVDEDYVRTRLRMIPLRPQISETLIKTLRFSLDAKNETDTVMAIYSGDLSVVEGVLGEPLFNPTHEIAFLQPGRTLHIKNIRIDEGVGHQDAAFTVATRAAARPLDLEEYPREATHGASGPAALQSGYILSSLVANPRRHEIVAYLRAVPAGGTAALTVLTDACGSIMRRLRYVLSVLGEKKAPPLATALSGNAALSGDADAATLRASHAYFIVTPDGPRTKGVLVLRNETDTIGQLLRRAIYELVPDIGYVGHECIPHENKVKLTVCHVVSEPAELGLIVTRAVKHAYGIFNQIQLGIRAKA